MDENKEMLKRAKAALKEGRDQRYEDRSVLSAYLEGALSNGDRDTAVRALKEASARNMLREATVWRKGKKVVQEMAAVKAHEPYDKRPSVRALKAAKRKYPRPQM